MSDSTSSGGEERGQKTPPLAVPQFGSCVFLSRHRPYLGSASFPEAKIRQGVVQPLPRLLEPASSQADTAPRHPPRYGDLLKWETASMSANVTVFGEERAYR